MVIVAGGSVDVVKGGSVAGDSVDVGDFVVVVVCDSVEVIDSVDVVVVSCSVIEVVGDSVDDKVDVSVGSMWVCVEYIVCDSVDIVLAVVVLG